MYGATENETVRPMNQVAIIDIDGFSNVEYFGQDIAVRMTVPSHPMWHFVDEGETVELYVTFGEGVVGIQYTNRGNDGQPDEFTYKVELAGEEVPLTPLMSFEGPHCTMFKATNVVKSSGNRVEAGRPVPFSLQYTKGENRNNVLEETEVTEPNMPVYYQPFWKNLLARDDSLIKRIKTLERGGGPSGEPSGEASVPAQERNEAADETDSNDSRESAPLLERSFTRSETPTQLAKDDFFLYYTRKCCTPFFHSQNSCLKILRELMVSPLTNFTGLSLYFQLYLVEVFHVKFYTKLFHYLCMPMIVLFLATWFAQWRIIGWYRIEDVSIFIVNGTLVFLLILQLWYLVWGCLYRMLLFGLFMVWPLFFMYMLANMLFQIIVINSYWIKDGDLSVSNVKEVWGADFKHWYDVITLAHFHVVWYLNPLLWALVFAAVQALSHIFEDKLPPRVSHTAHWMDITTILRHNGYVTTSYIFVSQFIFGTLNEFVASPRLLPILLLRMCYNLGYEEKQWVKFRLLVDECLKFGDPAIDYIGRGGANWPRRFNEFDPNNLQSKIEAIERGMSKEQKENLKDPKFLRNTDRFTKELRYYVLLRNRLTKYKIQVNAYGPFTPKEDNENIEHHDNMLMKNDFPDDPAFNIFLKEARSHFAEMEYTFMKECKLNRFSTTCVNLP